MSVWGISPESLIKDCLGSVMRKHCKKIVQRVKSLRPNFRRTKVGRYGAYREEKLLAEKPQEDTVWERLGDTGGLLCWLGVREPTCQHGRWRPPGEGNGNPL